MQAHYSPGSARRRAMPGGRVDPDSLPDDVKVTHVNLYDGTVEGLRCLDRPIYSVQYHPEAAPGPHDAEHHFQRFVALMEEMSRS